MVNIGVDIGVLGSILAVAIALAGWIQTGRKTAMAEGKHLQEVADLKAEVASLKGTVRTVQECYQTTDGDLREIRADMTWVKKALEEIKESIARWVDR